MPRTARIYTRVRSEIFGLFVLDGLFHALSPNYALLSAGYRFQHLKEWKTVLHQLTHIPYAGFLDGPSLILTRVSFPYRM